MSCRTFTVKIAIEKERQLIDGRNDFIHTDERRVDEYDASTLATRNESSKETLLGKLGLTVLIAITILLSIGVAYIVFLFWQTS